MSLLGGEASAGWGILDRSIDRKTLARGGIVADIV
jgi:hypothetical protein